MISNRILGGFAATILAFAFTFASLAPAQERSTNSKARATHAQAEHGITEEQAERILAELRAIRELLQKQMTQDRLLLVPADQPQRSDTDQNVEIGIANHWHSLGRQDAPLTLLEFTDYQCPFCRAFNSELFPRLNKDYVQTGKLRYVSLDLPLPQHPEARNAGEAARCAGDQNKYWEFRDAILNDKRSLSESTMTDLAHSLALNADALRTCITSHLHAREFEEDQADAAALQINATPTFVLGRTSEGQLHGTILRGVLPYPAFQAKLDEMLKTSVP